MMNGEQNNFEIEEMESEGSRNLDDLRKKVELSNIKLLELAYNDEKFMSTIEELNMAGIKGIQTEKYREALTYFHENEKILEYAASCGKTIDRSIIIVTLHNEACAYQKLWDLDRSVNYLEAILFNIKPYWDSMETKKFTCHQRQISPQPSQVQLEENLIRAHKKQKYVLYLLQYCAINSQLKKHFISVSKAKKSIKWIKQICKSSLNILNLLQCSSLKQESTRKRDNHILNELIQLEQNLQMKNYDIYLEQVKQIIRSKQSSSRYQEELKHLKMFSIGRLMQIAPIQFTNYQKKPTYLQYFTFENLILKVLYLGISYFTIGAQLRFISSQSTDTFETDPKLSEEFLLSEVYHIYAILIVLKFVPIDTIFLNHLITSFSNHYLIDLEKISLQRKENYLFPIENKSEISERKFNLLPQESEIKTSLELVNKNENESNFNKNIQLKQSEKIIILRQKSHSREEKYNLHKERIKNKEKLNTEPHEASKQNISTKKRKSLSKKENGKKNFSNNKKKRDCIYTAREHKERDISSSPDFTKNEKCKSKSKSRKKIVVRQFQRTSQVPFQTTRFFFDDQNEKNLKNIIKPKRTSKSRGKSRTVEEYQKKIPKSKSKNKNRKEKIKNQKITGIKITKLQ